MILSLYTLLPPRRNKDFLECNVIKKYNDELENTKNYLDLNKQEFRFNQFKTAKSEGSQIIKIPDDLMKVITIYLKFHPNYSKDKNLNIPFLVYFNGKPLDKVNSITLILNKIFGKKIGSSMLRHIYLTSKYGDIQKEMQEDAKIMSHSVGQQAEYIKK